MLILYPLAGSCLTFVLSMSCAIQKSLCQLYTNRCSQSDGTLPVLLLGGVTLLFGTTVPKNTFGCTAVTVATDEGNCGCLFRICLDEHEREGKMKKHHPGAGKKQHVLATLLKQNSYFRAPKLWESFCCLDEDSKAQIDMGGKRTEA